MLVCRRESASLQLRFVGAIGHIWDGDPVAPHSHCDCVLTQALFHPDWPVARCGPGVLLGLHDPDIEALFSELKDSLESQKPKNLGTQKLRNHRLLIVVRVLSPALYLT